ncbi:hypothetical protein [Microbacterium paraoxydans]|uniref:Integral membrane protein n=1 Tax=Microbacterium paraoxydans TaxID=199592 RepID=A0ABS5ILB9_9MICO|nr:hypothetical protein [Microbacterium paraoxydans]MBS0023749.1 hypothetical protein [Microbacterium paraoxydans]
MSAAASVTGVTAGEGSGPAAVDPVLRRLPAAAWRALAPLAVTGATGLAAWAFGAALLGPGSPAVPVLVVAACATPAAWALGALHDGLFDHAAVRLRRRVLTVAVGAGAPALLLAWAQLIGVVAGVAEVPLFPVLALAAVLGAAALSVVAVVAVPVAALRDDVSLRTVAVVCAVAALRRPLAPVAALAVPIAVAWLGLTWFGGLLLLVAPLLVLLSVAAAWPVAAESGVALPPLTPGRRPARGES